MRGSKPAERKAVCLHCGRLTSVRPDSGNLWFHKVGKMKCQGTGTKDYQTSERLPPKTAPTVTPIRHRQNYARPKAPLPPYEGPLAPHANYCRARQVESWWNRWERKFQVKVPEKLKRCRL